MKLIDIGIELWGKKKMEMINKGKEGNNRCKCRKNNKIQKK
jgi:hypothetical protein